MTKRLHIEIRVDGENPLTSEVEFSEDRDTWDRAADAAAELALQACQRAVAEPEERVP